jgi:hypothetical protein
MREDDRVSTVTFTLPAGHQWTTVEAALREAHDREYELRMAFFWRCQYLEAKVAALTKAGDAMVPLLGRGDWHIARNDWNAAKEPETR